MTSKEIREQFLQYFERNDHKRIPSSSLLPDDPSVLLTTAGMQQFKPYFLGEADPIRDFKTRRTTSVQKSFRTTDIDEVGDESHLTFFEMLGNFSLGDYFKKDAIAFAWELLTDTWKLPKDRLAVTVFAGEEGIPKDDEAIALWKDIGVVDDKIFALGREDNFWGPPGETGPSGPSSEIHYDITQQPCAKRKDCDPSCDCGRYLEIWNLVFMQYFKNKQGEYTDLPKPSIDTGMGLERITMVLQNAPNIFATDLFLPVIKNIKELTDLPDSDQVESSSRIIADHLRGSVFLAADGVLPSNMEQGYILRRILRKAIRHGKLLNLPDDFIFTISNQIIDQYKDFYPELSQRQAVILTIIEKEDDRFRATLEKGLKEFNRIASKTTEAGQDTISGEDSFHLYDTYGFPLELTVEMANERNLKVDHAGFEEFFKKHQEISRAGLEQKFGGHGLLLDTGELKAKDEEELKKVIKFHTATHLLHRALRQVLGEHVKQMGSDITAERLRFDFSHPEKMTAEQKKEVEDLVNEQISRNLTVTDEEMTFEDAVKQGALAFFKGKYPKTVKVYSIGDFSKEVCGGPHVESTKGMGIFKIKKEQSSSAGVRRIKAILE